MRIQNTGSTSGIRDARARSKTSSAGSGFSVNTEPETPDTAQTATLSNVTHLDALLSLQTIEDATTGKKRTAARGFDLLDRLDEMRSGLLAGRLSVTQIDQIAHKIRLLGRTGDTKLDSILNDIDMRARVELAKLGVYEI